MNEIAKSTNRFAIILYYLPKCFKNDFTFVIHQLFKIIRQNIDNFIEKLASKVVKNKSSIKSKSSIFNALYHQHNNTKNLHSNKSQTTLQAGFGELILAGMTFGAFATLYDKFGALSIPIDVGILYGIWRMYEY